MARGGSPTGKKLKALLAVVLLLVVIGVVAVALSPRLPEGTGSDGDGDDEPALVNKPAKDLVIALSDMEAGWVLSSEENMTVDAEGFRDGYERVIGKVESEFTTRAIFTTAWTFETIDSADAYFDSLIQEVQANFSTEARSFGDEAFYWEEIGDFIHMHIRKSNVVWEVSLYREGTFTWEPAIDWVSGTVVAKA